MSRTNAEIATDLRRFAPLMFWSADVISATGGGDPAAVLREAADRLDPGGDRLSSGLKRVGEALSSGGFSEIDRRRQTDAAPTVPLVNKRGEVYP